MSYSFDYTTYSIPKLEKDDDGNIYKKQDKFANNTQQNRFTMLFSDSDQESPQKLNVYQCGKRKIDLSQFDERPNKRMKLYETHHLDGHHTDIYKRKKSLFKDEKCQSNENILTSFHKINAKDEENMLSDHYESKIDHKINTKRKSKIDRKKNTKDGGNAGRIHGHKPWSISQRTRNSKKIRKRYNKQIRKEYDNLQKDSIITQDGKHIDVVCLD